MNGVAIFISSLIAYVLVGSVAFGVTERIGWGEYNCSDPDGKVRDLREYPPPFLVGLVWPLFCVVFFGLVLLRPTVKFGRWVASPRKPKIAIPTARTVRK